jgi:uncharacterized protein (TIGR02265 family)
MDEKKVKGTMLIDLVRMIRLNKDKDWNKHLKPEDWDIINSLILPTKWYPLDFFSRCGLATFNVLAEGKLELSRFNGRMTAKTLFTNTYKSVVDSKDPMKGLTQFVTIYGAFFNFSSLKLEKLDKNHAKIHHDYDAGDQSNLAYAHQLMGMLDTLIEMNGAKNPKITLSAKQWEGAPATTFDITWA